MHGSHADAQFVPDAKLAAGGSPLRGSPVIGSAKNPTSKCAGQPTPGPGAVCFNIDGTPRPATGPWNAGAY